LRIKLLWIIAAVIVVISFLMIILPASAYTEVQYSLDNTSWASAGISNNASITIEAVNNGIDADKEYFFRLRHVYTNGSTAWVYTQTKTEEGGLNQMEIAIIMGLGIAAFICIYFAFNLENEHTLLKILMVFFTLILLILIPSSILTNTTAAARTFMKVTLWILRAFALYIFIYFNYTLWVKSKLIDFGLLKRAKK